jgi:hypothetical protein
MRLSENDCLELFIWIPDTFPSNCSYTLLEEAHKVPQAAAFGSIRFLRKVPNMALRLRSAVRSGMTIREY